MDLLLQILFIRLLEALGNMFLLMHLETQLHLLLQLPKAIFSNLVITLPRQINLLPLILLLELGL